MSRNPFAPWFAAPLLLAVAGHALGQIQNDREAAKNPLNYCHVEIIHQVDVPAKDAGVLDLLNVQEGQNVEKGALLGSIDKEDAELAVKIATAEYNAAKKTAENTISIQYAIKSYEVARADLNSSMDANETAPNTVTKQQMRSQRLQADRSIMQAEMAKHEYEVAQLDALAKLANYERATAAIKRRDIISPLNGVIVKKYKHEGDWVQPGETVLKIIQMDRLWVEGNCDATTYARHEVLNRPVKITVELTGGGTEVLTGRVVFASPLVVSNEYKIRAEVQNRKAPGSGNQWLLSPGLDARMEFTGSAPATGTGNGGNGNLFNF